MKKLINIEFHNNDATPEEEREQTFDNGLKDYIKDLVESEKDAQDNYDKTILTLSSSAFGISFAFIKDIVGSDPLSYSYILILAWSCWLISMAFVLYSYFMSNRAFRKAIDQAYKGKIYEEHPGGIFEKITDLLNILSGSLFVVGLILIIIFVSQNI